MLRDTYGERFLRDREVALFVNHFGFVLRTLTNTNDQFEDIMNSIQPVVSFLSTDVVKIKKIFRDTSRDKMISCESWTTCREERGCKKFLGKYNASPLPVEVSAPAIELTSSAV